MSFFKKIYSAFTTSERKAFFYTIGIFIIAAVISIATFLVQNTKAIPTIGGEFTEGTIGQPEYVNPVMAQTETDLALVKLIYANLPTLADSIQVSPDGKTYDVRLKENLRWQDNQKLTSDDVIFTVQSIQDPDANSPLATTWSGVTVSRASELEVTFSLAAPSASFNDTLANLYILPKHLFAGVPPGNWHFSNYNLKPVGSGPYQFTSYDRDGSGFISGYHLAAWPDFVGTHALIQNFNFSFFANQTNIIQAFNTAQIDGFTATPQDLANVNRPANITAWRTSEVYAVFLNQGANTAFTDPAVRAALAEAIDRNAITAQALGPYGVPDTSPVPPDASYAIVIPASNSTDLASQNLSNAGWNINSDGVRQKTISKATTTLSFTLTVPDVDFLVNTAQQLQSAWQAIGAQVTIATDTPENIAANQIKNRNYDAVLYGETLGPSSDLYAFWDSAEEFSARRKSRPLRQHCKR